MTDKILLPISLGKRPTYRQGQLLKEGDFLDEQNYHAEARQQHNRHVHGWGIVHGLMIRQIDEKIVEVGPGHAIDQNGRELVLEKNEHLNLSDFTSDRAEVYLYYEEGVEGEFQNRVECNAVLAVTSISDELPAEKVLLGLVRLVGGEVGEIDISLADYQRKHRMFSNWITPQDLNRELRVGWLTLPFHPTNLDEALGNGEHIPEGMRGTQPNEFEVGFTEARAPEGGAGGNMAFPLPPGANSLKKFRIAGRINEGDISIMFVVAGWDPEQQKHIFEKRLTHTIKGGSKAADRGAYDYVGKLKEDKINPINNTLVLQVLASRKAHVSMVAVEFGYWE